MGAGIISAVISVIALVYFLKAEDTKKAGIFVGVILAAGFLFRIATFWIIQGYETDILCFTGWAESAYKLGLPEFYKGAGFVDYPPGYIYVLYITGFIADIFNIDTASVLYNFILKLPSMMADVLTAAIIYNFAKTKISENKAAALCAIYVFNPFVYLTSTLWGQVDSVFALLIVAALVLLYDKKHIASACVYALALLVKPQALVLFPIYIFYIILFVKNGGIKAVKTAVLSVLSGAAVFFVLLVPFSLSSGVSWIFELYYNTLSSYPYATLNAPNFYGMIGANGMDVGNTFMGFSYSVWSFGFILLLCGFAAWVYFKQKDDSAIFASGTVLISGMYVLAAKMHERYIFPVFVLLLILAAVNKKKYPVVIAAIFSLTSFAVCAKVLGLSIAGKSPWIDENDIWFIIISVINVIAFIVMIHLMLRQEKISIKNIGKNKIIPVVMVLIYSVIAFANLGDAVAPETFWNNEAGNKIVIEFAEITDIERVNIYNGRLSADEEKHTIEVMVDEENTNTTSFALESVFCWKQVDLNMSAERLVLKTDGYIGEIAIYSQDGRLVEPVFVMDEMGNDVPEVFDEQNRVIYQPSFKNGTYFDEIYHARTAYEYINGIEAYEWTHPPLGKLIIGIGIKIFGMNPFGWRVMGTLVGVLMLPIMYELAKLLFKNTKYAVCALVLLACDFMHFTQTRIATIDVYTTFFIMLMYLFMYKFYKENYNMVGVKKPFKYLAAAGVCFGLGAATKWPCIYAGIGLAVIFAVYMVKRFIEYRRGEAEQYIGNTVKTLLWCVLFFVIVPIGIYILSYLPYAFLEPNGFTLANIWRIQKNMFDYHAYLEAEHPFSSMWYEWPIIAKPMWYHITHLANNKIMTISAFGNPAVWWAGIPAVAISLYYAITNRKNAGVFALLMIGYAAQYLPWALIGRIVFIYHYFPSVPFVCLIITYAIKKMYESIKTEKGKKAFSCGVYTYLVVAALLFVMFYPAISGMTVNRDYVTNVLTWFDGWYIGG